MATDLRSNFILYLPVTPEEAGTRKIVKIAFDSPRPVVDRSGFRVRLGWRDAEDSFRVPLAGYGSSYHFELEAPTEMEITDGSFVATRTGESVADLQSNSARRAHFNLADLDRGGGRVAVRLRARSAMLGGTAVLSVMNTAALGFVLLRLSEFTTNNNGASVVPALIAIPGILIGYITRPSEHAMVTSFLADLRRVALSTGITSFVAAFLLVAGFSEGALRPMLVLVWTLALVASLTLVVSWYMARVRN
jgi:hypothetical protein